MNIIIKSLILSLFCLPSFVNAQKTDSANVKHFKFNQLETKNIGEQIVRQSFSGKEGTLGIFTYKKGGTVPTHQHPNEQYSLITKGSVKVIIDGHSYIVQAGEGIYIPANVPHSFVALEDDTIDIDFFAPLRMDWINKTDNYYKKQ